MMRTSDMIKSNYISKAEVKAAGRMILTIVDCSLEKIGADEKWVLWFNEHPKGLGLNNTKIRLLEAAYGEESGYWTGKRVKLTFDPTVMMSGQVIGGIKLECSTQGQQRGNGHAAVPPGAPPPPVWNGTAWVTQAPAPAPPQPPVWDGTRWVVQGAPPPAGAEFDSGTGEIHQEAPPARQARPQTISERVNQEHPPAAGYETFPPPGSPSEFDDTDIPF